MKCVRYSAVVLCVQFSLWRSFSKTQKNGFLLYGKIMEAVFRGEKNRCPGNNVLTQITNKIIFSWQKKMFLERADGGFLGKGYFENLLCLESIRRSWLAMFLVEKTKESFLRASLSI